MAENITTGIDEAYFNPLNICRFSFDSKYSDIHCFNRIKYGKL
jgi:hypothetical protein